MKISLLQPNPFNGDLLEHPHVLIDILRRIDAFCTKFHIPWYIHCSLAFRIYSLSERKVSDLDIRVNWPIKKLHSKIQKHLDKNAQLRPPVKYAKGEFRNYCIIMNIKNPETYLHITTNINTYRKDYNILFRLPFDQTFERRQIHPDFQDTFPVCSLEYLIIYKLIHNRDKSERKNDLSEVAILLNSLEKKWSDIK